MAFPSTRSASSSISSTSSAANSPPAKTKSANLLQFHVSQFASGFPSRISHIIAPRMSLTPGTKLGPYEIVSPLGAGGMGEVYRARDKNLGRDVAIKILPEQFAQDQQRMSRFEREAQLLAALNHPHIAHIYGFEDSNGAHALVMELVEGPTLPERIE